MAIRNRRGLQRGNGNGNGGGLNRRMAKYSGHTHNRLGYMSSQTTQGHDHDTLIESPLHIGASGHMHQSSMAGSPAHSHLSQTYGNPDHTGSMGTHEGGWPSGPSTGSYHNHNMATGSGTHLHQKGQRPPQPRSGRGGGRRGAVMGSKRPNRRPNRNTGRGGRGY